VNTRAYLARLSTYHILEDTLRLARRLGESSTVINYISYAITAIKYNPDVTPAIQALLLAKQYVTSKAVELMINEALSYINYVYALENNIGLDPA
jgi:hypothetical protein